MGKIAFVFSGQGAQYPGMGKELCEISAAAAEVFRLADELRPGTSAQCFGASQEELSQTINTQPCLYCMDLAAAEALREKGVVPQMAAGFSLGEIAALTFTGALTPKDGFSLVCHRARLMSEAAGKTGGGMAAVLKLSPESVEELCREFPGVYPVNYNSPGQIAVAGEETALDGFCDRAREAGARVVTLSVIGAFHSPYRDEAAKGLGEYLKTVPVSLPDIPLYSNWTGEKYSGENLKTAVEMQVNHPVRWQTIVEKMAAEGVDTFVEVGAGKTLCGLIKKTVKNARVYHVEDGASLSKGQKQLLTIARAMLLDARILILDEATSNVDTETELQIQAAMRQLMQGKTCFVIAHRLSTIRNADTILVVDQGQIVEQGRHGELMEKKGFYYRLYQAQFQI